MKQILLLIALIIGAGTLKAQAPGAGSAIPPYRILTKDSTYLTPANLKKNKPVMVVYFSPDCTHCQHFTEELKLRMDNESKSSVKTFRNTQIVMVTFTPLMNMKLFYVNFGLASYPNIVMGTEGSTYIVLRYYNVKNTPYIAVYDKKGKLIQGFEKVPKMEDLEAALKKA